MRRPLTSRLRICKPGDDILDKRIDRTFTTDDVCEQLRILELEYRLEGLLFFFRRVRVPPIEVPLQQNIELAHAAPATPLEPRELGGRRSHDINADARRSSA